MSDIIQRMNELWPKVTEHYLSYNSIPNKTEITWEDVKKAALNTTTTPFTPSEMVELLTLQNDDKAFYKRMFEMLKNGE